MGGQRDKSTPGKREYEKDEEQAKKLWVWYPLVLADEGKRRTKL